MSNNYYTNTIKYFMKRIYETPLVICYLIGGSIFSVISQGMEGLTLTVINLFLLGNYAIIIKRFAINQNVNDYKIKRPKFELIIGIGLFIFFIAMIFCFFGITDIKIISSINAVILDLSYGNNSILNKIPVPHWLLNTAQNAVYSSFSMTIPMIIIFIILGYQLKSMGLRFNNYKLTIILVMVTIAFGLPFGVLTRQPILQVLGIFIVHIFINALPEELFFRGFLLPRFEAVLSNSLNALVVVSILFNMLHIPSYIYNGQSIAMAIATSLSISYPSGLAWGYLYLKTRSVVPGIAWHASNTVLGGFFLG